MEDAYGAILNEALKLRQERERKSNQSIRLSPKRKMKKRTEGLETFVAEKDREKSPKSFLRKHQTRRASQVAHSPRKHIFKAKKSIQDDQNVQDVSPVKMLSPKLKTLLEKLENVKSPERRSRLRNYADRIYHSLGISVDDGEKITIREGETFNARIPGFHPSKSRWKSQNEHDPEIVQFSIKFVFDDKTDPEGVLEGYTNINLTGLKPGLTTVCMKQICTWIPGSRNESVWRRNILVTGSSFVSSFSSPSSSEFVATTAATTTEVAATRTKTTSDSKTKMLTTLQKLEPILRRHSETRSNVGMDPRYDLLLARLLTCIKEHSSLQASMSENEMLIEFLEREQDRLNAQYHQRGTPDHDAAIARQASAMLDALDSIENETKTKAQKIAEKKQDKHLHHMMRSARSKFARFDMNDDCCLDREELCHVVEWMWKDFHVHGEPLTNQKRAEMVQHILDTFDRNHDGKISYAEFERLFRRVAEKISRYRRAEHGTSEVEKMKEKDVVYSKHTQKRRDLCVHLVDGTRRVFSAMQNCVARYRDYDLVDGHDEANRLSELGERLDKFLSSIRRVVASSASLAFVDKKEKNRETLWCHHVDEAAVRAHSALAVYTRLALPAPVTTGDHEISEQKKKELRHTQHELAQAKEATSQILAEYERSESEALDLIRALKRLNRGSAFWTSLPLDS